MRMAETARVQRATGLDRRCHGNWDLFKYDRNRIQPLHLFDGQGLTRVIQRLIQRGLDQLLDLRTQSMQCRGLRRYQAGQAAGDGMHKCTRHIDTANSNGRLVKPSTHCIETW